MASQPEPATPGNIRPLSPAPAPPRPRASAGEGELVVLVDRFDRTVGTMGKIAAHKGEGALHRAFSVFLFDRVGRTLLQRRADAKYHFGGLWTNACCGHPRPEEPPVEAGRRRLREEMGIDTSLRAVGTFTYEARDEAAGLVEREIDHVLVSRFDGTPQPNPAEASDWCWMEPEALDRAMRARPGVYTPWFRQAWEIARHAHD